MYSSTTFRTLKENLFYSVIAAASSALSVDTSHTNTHSWALHRHTFFRLWHDPELIGMGSRYGGSRRVDFLLLQRCRGRLEDSSIQMLEWGSIWSSLDIEEKISCPVSMKKLLLVTIGIILHSSEPLGQDFTLLHIKKKYIHIHKHAHKPKKVYYFFLSVVIVLDNPAEFSPG